MTRLIHALSLLALGAGWSLTIPLNKIAISSGHPPLGLVFWQLVFVSVLLGAFALVRRSRLRLTRKILFYFTGIALIGTFLPHSFMFTAAAQLPAGIMSIAIATVPLFSLAIASTIQLDRPSPLRFAGLALGLGAIVILFTQDSALPDPGKAGFLLIALIAPFCYAVEGNFIAHMRMSHVDPVLTLLGASLIGVLVALPVTLVSGAQVDLAVPWGKPEWALLLSSVFHALGYTGYVWLVKQAGPVFSSQIAYVVTIAGVFASGFLLQEHYSGMVYLALALMLAGMALVRPRPSSSPAA